MSKLFEEILKARGLTGAKRDAFLNPSYDARHDPFLLPDMAAAVDRLVIAREKQEKITIYGDYDIDGLTASTVLIDAFESFGFEHVDIFIPNRFVEGYGLTVEAVEKIAATGAQLIVTVDCGSLSEKEIIRANELGVDIIVTDHHNVAPVQPPAVAVINPKRLLQDYPDDYENFILKQGSSMQGKIYPFLDLAGVGVAFKLVQALQTRLDGLEDGQEKWLLDLVALGTVCDIVTLVDENRANVYWGLKVMAKTRRPGLKALMAVSGVEPEKVNARSLGFGLGPRMNAAGRLETAQYALDMLRATDNETAFEKAQLLDDMNKARRAEQDKILEEAIVEAEQRIDDPVLVVSGKGWNHGIIGIVAAKLLERYKKPTYVLEEMGEEAKGSARSYGDFSAADAIRSADDIITKGGGHKLAAGVTLPTKNIQSFRERVNKFYRDQKLFNQQALLLPKADVTADFNDVTEDLIEKIATLEPFGSGNPQPILTSKKVLVINTRRMGADSQHVKLELQGVQGLSLQLLAFNAPDHFFVQLGEYVTVWYQPDINEWNGRRTVEGRLLNLELH
ncbi:MAG TPA: DHHA1 domain-containing protein [Candidatus Saccharibacteria bacterium]|nr:DHHA1 domain-containing protein [Candidatus Saccharibacteria bacterium]